MEIKRQIVESKTPPSNKEVWWFDNNEEVLKRYYRGSWAPVASSKEFKKAVFSPFDIPDDEIWIIAPGAEKLEFPDAIRDESDEPVTLHGYYEYLLRGWEPYDEGGDTMSDWSVFYDADTSLYRIKSPKSSIKMLYNGILPNMPKVDSVVLILPKSCIYIGSNAVSFVMYDDLGEDRWQERPQINNLHILLTASRAVGMSENAFELYGDPDLGVINVYLYIYSNEYTVDTEEGDVIDREPIIDCPEGDFNWYVYVQHYLVDEYDNDDYYWGDATIKKLS